MLGFITGLNAEARLLAAMECLVAVGGGTPAGARRAAFDLSQRGATALISFGLAGGLDPALRPGTLIVPAAVVSGENTYICDHTLTERMGGITVARLTGSEAIVLRADEKKKLYHLTGASAVDLESTCVAEVACQHHIPFAVIRAVADPAWRDLPTASIVALDSQGRIALGPMLAQVFFQPRQITGLIRLAGDAAAGRKTLMRAARLILSD